MVHSRRLWKACAFLIAGPLLVFAALSFIFPLPDPKPYSLVVEDRNGQFVHAFIAPDGIWRLKTGPEEIPPRLKRILLEKEDRWFRYHPGVNPFAVVRALVQNIRSGKRMSGASTITMQIARMLEPKDRTVFNKIVEMFRAVQLEWRYSKDELLELYLSMVPLGGNIEGLKSAAMIYYQTPLERLNMAQLLDLILIPNDPNSFRPDRAAGRLFQERQRRAQQWRAVGLLTAEDSLIIASMPASATRHALPRLAPHFALRIKERGRGAARVRSTLDLYMQTTVERLLSHHLRVWKRMGVHNGAVLVVDNATHGIVAYAGSGDFYDSISRGQVDAVRAIRSPGSTLKPFLYAMLMDRGELTPHTMLLDTPFDAEGFLAENYDGTYSGQMYAGDALRRSLNVPMIRLLKSCGVSSFLDFLRPLGVSSLQEQRSKLGLSMILGGCGVTLEELTAAYAAFPAGGVWHPLQFECADQTGETIHETAFSASAAFMVCDILAGLERPDLPNNFASSLNLPAVAFKTGTSYGRRDAWSMGFTREYTVGVWVGNADNRGNPELVGSRSAAPLLFDIFTSLSKMHEKIILAPPRDIRIRRVCARSGMTPGPRCTTLIDDYASAARTLSVPCTVCQELLTSMDGRCALCPSCLGDHAYRTGTVFSYPAELVRYWHTVGRELPVVPPHNHQCTRVSAGDGPSILSPSDRMTYYLVSQHQKLPLQATSRTDVKVHRWYLDDQYIGRQPPGGKLFVEMNAGEHTVACLDDRGRISNVRITVKFAADDSGTF